MDFALPGGWHVTIVHPWEWIAIGVMVLLACALVAKVVIRGARH